MANPIAPFTPTNYRFIDPVGGTDGGASDGTTIAKAWKTFVYALNVARGMGGGYVLAVKNGTTDTEGAIANGTLGTSSVSLFAITGMPRPTKAGMSGTFTAGSVSVTGVTGLTLTIANSETRTFVINGKSYMIGKWISATAFELVLPWDQSSGAQSWTFDADLWYDQFVADGKYEATWAGDDVPVVSHGNNVAGLQVKNFTIVSTISYLNTDDTYGYCCFAAAAGVASSLSILFHSVSTNSTGQYAGGLIGPYNGAAYNRNFNFTNCTSHIRTTPYNVGYMAGVSISYGHVRTFLKNCCFTGWSNCIDASGVAYYSGYPIVIYRCRFTPYTGRQGINTTAVQPMLVRNSLIEGNISASAPTAFIGIVPNCWTAYLTTKHLFSIGKITNQTSGDSNFGLGGQNSIQTLLSNVSALNIGFRNPMETSYTTAYCERGEPMPIYLPAAGTYKIRRNVNHQLSTLTNKQLWLEITDSLGNLTTSNNAALTTQTSASDWSQWVTSDAFTLSAAGMIYVNTFFCFYHASQMVALGALQWTNDNGATWTSFEMSGIVDGEPRWQLAPGSPAVGTVLAPTVYGPLGALVGTLPASKNIRDTRARRIEMIPKATAYPLEFQILSVSTGLPVDASALNTVSVQIAKDGGVLAAVTGAISKRTGLTGVYLVTLSTAETTCNDIWAYAACSDAGTYISPVNLQTDGGKLAGVADASTPPSRSVSGTALDSLGAALAGITVELKNGALQTVYKATTDQDGAFSIGCLDGSYSLTAVRSGYEFNEVAVVVTSSNVTGVEIVGTRFSITAPSADCQTVYLYPRDPSMVQDTTCQVFAEAVFPNQSINGVVLTGKRKIFSVVDNRLECQLIKTGAFIITGMTGNKKFLSGEIEVTDDETAELSTYDGIEWMD